MYGVDSTGRYDSEDLEQDKFKDREPNPTPTMTKDFAKTLKQEHIKVNSCFRYYLEDKSGKPDMYRREIDNFKKRIVCSLCKQNDEIYSLFAPPSV